VNLAVETWSTITTEDNSTMRKKCRFKKEEESLMVAMMHKASKEVPSEKEWDALISFVIIDIVNVKDVSEYEKEIDLSHIFLIS